MLQYENEGKPAVKGQTIAVRDYVNVSTELIEELDVLEVNDTVYYIEQDCTALFTDEEEPQPIKSDKLWFVSDLPKGQLNAELSKLEEVFKNHSNDYTKRK